MTQPARERALGRFAAGANDVLVATDVAARGLDLEHITHVINFDPPADEVDYVHRVGRTARAGRSGTGITFVTPEKREDVQRIATILELQAELRDAGLGADAISVAAASPLRWMGIASVASVRVPNGRATVRSRHVWHASHPSNEVRNAEHRSSTPGPFARRST